MNYKTEAVRDMLLILLTIVGGFCFIAEAFGGGVSGYLVTWVGGPLVWPNIFPYVLITVLFLTITIAFFYEQKQD